MRSLLRRRGARPEVSLENYAAVYDYFGPGRRRSWFSEPFFRLVSAVWAPEVRISTAIAAEATRLREAGVGIIVAANHPSTKDPFVLTGLGWDPRIRFLSRSVALSKDELFRGPTAPVFEYMGTLPVFRAKNYPDVPRETHLAASLRLIAECVDHLGAGGSVVAFVEGTTSAPEERRELRLESVKSGIGQMVSGVVESGRPVAILPFGFDYDGREHSRLPRGVLATAGAPVVWDCDGPVPTIDEVRSVAREAINSALAHR